MNLWDRLEEIRHIRISAHSNSPNGYQGEAIGVVECELHRPDTIIFRESGKWLFPPNSRTQRHQHYTSFTNVFRWVRKSDTRIELSHLRHGASNPVFLFPLIPQTTSEWVSETSHHCINDHYYGSVHIHDDQLKLQWRIDGPVKDDTLIYCYTR